MKTQSLEERSDVKLGDPEKFIEIMDNRKRNFDTISEENWETRKEEYSFIPYFEKLKEDLEFEFSQTKKGNFAFFPIVEINSQELLQNLKKVWEKKFVIWSSDSKDWLPIRVTEILQWIKGNDFCHPTWTNLGIMLIKTGRRELLNLLEEAGDKKAKQIKKRNKFPKELSGKHLEWIKLSETEWFVEVTDKIETHCEYDKIYDQYKDLWE
jgi:hypothetical protein